MGQNIRGLDNIIIVSSWFIYSWLQLALQVKVGKVISFAGNVCGPVALTPESVHCHRNYVCKMVQIKQSVPTTKITNILLHENYPNYTVQQKCLSTSLLGLKH